MNPLTVLVVDDERLALERLSSLLTAMPGVRLLGCLQDGREAIATIAALKPDLLLLDVEMPGTNGFDIVDALGRTSKDNAPLICFVTAYPQFAVEAFEASAIDFLCKPVRPSRLIKAIERARRLRSQQEAAKRLEALANDLETLKDKHRRSGEDLLWLNMRGSSTALIPRQIDWIEAEGEYVRIHEGDSSRLLRSSLTALAKALGSTGFVRIHRSIAINSARLAGLRTSRKGMSVVLQGGLQLPVGRNYRAAVRALFHSPNDT